MDKTQAERFIELLGAAYPKMDISAATTEVYLRCLGDLPFDALSGALLKHISTNKWFPTVAELRQAAVEMDERNYVPSAAEAWGEVHKMIQDIGYMGDPKFSHLAIEKTVKAMGWTDLCHSEEQMADRAHFLRLYESYAQRMKEALLMLPEVKELRRQIEAVKPGMSEKIRLLSEAKRVD